jgi:integrase
MARKKLTPAVLGMRPPTTGETQVRDSESPLVFRVTAAGHRTLTVRTRLDSQQVRLQWPHTVEADTLGKARKWANDVVTDCKAGRDPRLVNRAMADTFGAVADDFLARHASKNRTAAETKRLLTVYALPSWRTRKMADISRADVASLLDRIEGGEIALNGAKVGTASTADHVLAAVRKCLRWYEARHDSYRSPIVPGMRRSAPVDRDRILTDAELKAVWQSCSGVYGAFVRFLLLTACRRDEAASMTIDELDTYGTWTVPAARVKNKRDHVLPLPQVALRIIASVPSIDGSTLVFTTNGKAPVAGFSKFKRDLDSKSGVTEWRLHDLRRTARTLLSRLGVLTEVSEAVLGHVIPGVRGVYDRYSYFEEKAAALDSLAAEVGRIVS